MTADPPSTALCAGDRFITAAALDDALRRQFGAITIRTVSSDWPDTPFRDIDGVREAAGDPGDLVAAVPGAEIVVTHLAPVTRAVFEAADRLRVVGVTRGGPVNVDLAAATEHGVPVIYLPGRNLEAVAEYTVGLLITLPRRIATAARQLAGGQWDARWFRYELTGPELATATVGLVGFGAVGRRVAALLRAFGSTVLAYDPYVDAADARQLGVTLTDLDDLLRTSDLVSVHARLTDDTRGLIGARALSTMRPGAYLINTARGELVDQHAVHAALQSGRLAGAALDVFHPEPPDPADPLLRRPDVVVTPHLAGASQEVATRSARLVATDIAEFLRTGRITHCANPAALDGAAS